MRGVVGQDTMIFWLARVAAEARGDANVKHVRIAAALNMDQSTISRFERGKSWPRDADAIIRAYAEELEIDERELWRRALERWIATPPAPPD